MREIILLKQGEMVLKGLNRRGFEDKLMGNAKRRLKKYGSFKVYTRQSATYIEPQDESCDFEGLVPGQSLPQGQGRHRGLCQGVPGGQAARRPLL